ncbi:MAG: Glu/Leu/Phe/Val dehydrogenase [Candidatus Marinimicrobia bacterium]|nr:Glu/Leu/Phe/Val dehydrogenase [Candidatus Neomarinimicrobiota bacterium]
MGFFDAPELNHHEQVLFGQDDETGLKAIIAVHNTSLGPALGGCRVWNYENEQDAVRDVLRLSEGMTYKSALAGLNLGGGKSVILGRVRDVGNEATFRAFGRIVDSLGGRYVTAEDVNTTPRMMEWVHEETDYVAGLSPELGGSGDPSPFTAYGTYVGIKSSANKAYGSDSLEGKTIAVQGLGHVGIYLVEHLSKAGAKIIVTDIKEDRIKEMLKIKNVTAVAPDEIYDVDMDIFAPCALGSIVNDETIDRLKCQVIAGAANNILSDYDKHGKILLDRGVLYAPDYAINAGGVINVYGEFEGYNEKRSYSRVNHIYEILQQIFKRSEDEGIPTMDAADNLAEERIRKIGRLKQMHRSGTRLFSKL